MYMYMYSTCVYNVVEECMNMRFHALLLYAGIVMRRESRIVSLYFVDDYGNQVVTPFKQADCGEHIHD